jgi:hypothetical protein
MKILLVQLAAMGDCLFVTTIARQIKEVDFPRCHLSWMINSNCKTVLINNPYVDDIIDVETYFAGDGKKINKYIASLEKQGRKFDKIIITDFVPDNHKYFYGPTRSCFFRAYGREITVPPEPLIYLTQEEVDNVAGFAKKHRLNEANYFPILFECSPQSKQSDMNIPKAIKIAQTVIKSNHHVKFILSSRERIPETNKQIIDGSVLTWRENAELTKYCKLLIGCSSGITWLNTSNWSAKIPMIQSLCGEEKYAKGILSQSVELDFMYFGISTKNLIELREPNDEILINCINQVIGQSVSRVKKNFMERKTYLTSEIDNYFLRKKIENTHSSTGWPIMQILFKICKILISSGDLRRRLKASFIVLQQYIVKFIHPGTRE